MERFLAHIVQRSQAGAPALAPRLAGRYEEGRAPAAFTAGADDAIAVLDAALAPAAPGAGSVPATDPGRQQPLGEPAPGFSPRERAEPAQPDPPARSDQAMPIPGAQPGTVLPGARTTDSTVPPARVSSAAPAGALAADTGPRLITGAASPASAGRVNPAARPLASAPHPAPRNDAGQPNLAPAGPDAAEPAPGFPAAHDTSSLVPYTSQPAQRAAPVRPAVAPSVRMSPQRQPALQSGALAEPPRRSAAPQASPGAAPVQAQAAQPVVVTIGRVELRAAPGAATPAPARATPSRPALSLGDYLQRRDQAEVRR